MKTSNRLLTQIKNLDSSFKLAWLMTSLLALIDRSIREQKILVAPQEAEVHDFARNHLGYDSSDPISAIAQYAFTWIKSLKKLDPIERDVDSNRPAAVLDETRLLQMIEGVVRRINEKGKRVYLFYDKLDERWDGSPLYVGFLQGALLAAKDLKALGIDLYPVVLLRSDIFEQITRDFQHIDHFRMEIDRIKWEEGELVSLISARIRRSAEVRGAQVKVSNEDVLWAEVFPAEIPHKRAPIPITAYMIERTLSRPRDIILFTNEAKDAAKRNRHTKATVEDLREAERKYSHMKLQDLQAEVSYRFPGLDRTA